MLQKTEYHYKVTVTPDQYIRFYLDGELAVEAYAPGYSGGYVGIGSWKGSVVFNNIRFQNYEVDQFSFQNNGNGEFSEAEGVYTVGRGGGDHHVVSDVYAEGPFTYEADIEITDGWNAMLTFGIANRENAGSDAWYAAGPDRKTGDGEDYDGHARVFSVRGSLDLDVHTEMSSESIEKTSYHYKVTMDSSNTIRYYVDGELLVRANDPKYEGGYLGLLTWNAEAKFSNVKITLGEPYVEPEEAGNFQTNLEGLKALSGSWVETKDGWRGSGNNDNFALSDTVVSDFIYETDVTINSGHAASLVFASNDTGSVAYVANVDLGQQNARIFRFSGTGSAVTLDTYRLPDPDQTVFHLRVEKLGSRMNYYLDGRPIMSCEDSTLSEGRLGLLLCNSDVTFQNVYYTPIDSVPVITSLGSEDMELIPAAGEAVTYYTASVPYETESVVLTAETTDGAAIRAQSVKKSNSEVITEEFETQGPEIQVSLAEGENFISLKPVKDGTEGRSVVLLVKRMQNPETYYTEQYRPQYHITPEENWLNDPNGLVYFQGEWHAFYQYYSHGKYPNDEKHWAHVVSTDLVHWEQLPIALSPDQYGSIWSGSCVADVNNTSGLFDGIEGGGLVAFYTCTDMANGLEQRQSMAYSLDKGRTWIKYNDGAPIIDSSDDPLHDGAFRDPKVFWHEESSQWMMIVAGGPVRFFSSKDLIHWTPEAMQPDIGTECADFYKMYVNGDPERPKWILSGAGVWYMIGDFEQVDGKWTFIPDTNERYDFNLAPDTYAGVTFNNTDRRIMISWMVDIGYPFQTGDVTDPYNGALTIPYEMELKEIDGKLQIVQYPVKELESLRGAEHNFDGTTVTEDTPNILKDVQLNMAEIRTTIDVGDASEVGFKLRTGNNQNTVVRYNAVTGMLTLDRTNSGANPTDWFNGTYSKKIDLVDGKLDLTMYLDWSSLEMFAEDGRYEYTALIFPDSDSSGMEFYVKGGTAKIEKLSIYELDSIYRDDPEVETPDSVSVVSGADTYYAGDQFTVSAVATPTQAALRGVDHWEVSDASVAEILEQSDRAAVLKALKGGTVTVSAIGGDGGVIGSLDITVQVSDFRTNLDGWTVIGGSWNETTEGFEGSGSGNSPVISGVRASDFEYEATVKYTEGNVGTALIFRAKDDLSVYYTVDICVRDQRARILKFHRDPETGSSQDWTLGEAYTFEPTEDQVYHLKVVTEGDLIRFYLNGELAVETRDSESLEGKFGLNVCDATAVFQDVYYTSSELPFEDVSEDDWYYDAVHYVYSKRVMTGLDPTSFKPLNTLLRAEFATTLYRMSGSPEVEYSDRFPDVHEDSWFVDPVLWAAENGIVTGYSQGPLAGYFDPAATIQRQQMAVMLYRYANFMGYDTSETASFEGYVDGDKVDEFAEEAMAWAVGSGMISGKYEQTVLDPQGSATRAECATMLQRFIEKYVDVQN